MNYLDQLTISNRILPTPSRRQNKDTAEYRRAKLIANIEEQIELAQLALKKEPLQLERKRGNQIRVVRPRIWWFVDVDGAILAQIRYNKVPLILQGASSTIEAESLKDLARVFAIVISAVKAGELDEAIVSAATKTTRPRAIPKLGYEH